ncbi:hypothetical protein Y1Q_0022114 [Alligator mississippiensis]|uniref:Uncharacterized protein n=1 Tax=Alligator mississippiensis TaxID=8496 RepID=A0A151M4Q1_ALLMI|nr:hypothetical protein Y1Q_0022114 [Alligator mississippiensis]
MRSTQSPKQSRLALEPEVDLPRGTVEGERAVGSWRIQLLIPSPGKSHGRQSHFSSQRAPFATRAHPDH